MESLVLVKVSDERYIRDLHYIKRPIPQSHQLSIYKQENLTDPIEMNERSVKRSMTSTRQLLKYV